MSAIIISPRGPRMPVGSLWELRDEVWREVEPDYQVGIHLREEMRGAEVNEPFIDIVVEEVVRGMTVDAVVGALRAAAQRWRASEAAPSLRAAQVRVWVSDPDGQVRLEWEEETADQE